MSGFETKNKNKGGESEREREKRSTWMMNKIQWNNYSLQKHDPSLPA
jgi:hypothetical protein